MAIYSLSTSDLLLLLLFAYCYYYLLLDAIFLLSFLSSDFLLLEVTDTQPYSLLVPSSLASKRKLKNKISKPKEVG